MISLVDLRGGLIETVGCDVGVTKEDDLVGRSERQVDNETVGCDVGVTKEDDLVGGSERQVDKETVSVMLE